METAIKIILGIMIAWCLFLFFFPDSGNGVKRSDALYDSLSGKIQTLTGDKDKLKDSLFGLLVEKGHIEVELNKSQSEVERLMSQGKKAKAVKDTPVFVQNCDSLIAELESRFIPQSGDYREFVDSIQLVAGRVINKYDTILDFDAAFRSRLKDDLSKERAINESLRAGSKKARNKTIWLTAGGFIVGVLTTVLLTK